MLVLMFGQQIAFGGFRQLLALFRLSQLGLNASGNSVIFVFVGVIVVAVQGGRAAAGGGPAVEGRGARKLRLPRLSANA
ncbi:MAG: hypothetical protein IT317_02665 [Anaerolineales bacterium]|nr:hypothetical protein [Anaerolineales bacterium]